MRRRSLFAVVAVTWILGCQTPELTRQELLQVQQQLEANVNGWFAAINNGQRDAVLAYYHQSDALLVIWPDGSVAHGYEAQRRLLHDFFNSARYVNMAAQQPSTEVLSARTAITTFGHSTDVILQDSRREVRPGHGTIIWLRDPDSNEWKIHIQHLSTNAPPLN